MSGGTRIYAVSFDDQGRAWKLLLSHSDPPRSPGGPLLTPESLPTYTEDKEAHSGTEPTTEGRREAGTGRRGPEKYR